MSVLHSTVASYDATDKLKVELTNTCKPRKHCARRALRRLVQTMIKLGIFAAFDQRQLMDTKSPCNASYLVIGTTSDTIRFGILLSLSEQQLDGMKPTEFERSCQ